MFFESCKQFILHIYVYKSISFSYTYINNYWFKIQGRIPAKNYEILSLKNVRAEDSHT